MYFFLLLLLKFEFFTELVSRFRRNRRLPFELCISKFSSVQLSIFYDYIFARLCLSFEAQTTFEHFVFLFLKPLTRFQRFFEKFWVKVEVSMFFKNRIRRFFGDSSKGFILSYKDFSAMGINLRRKNIDLCTIDTSKNKS